MVSDKAVVGKRRKSVGKIVLGILIAILVLCIAVVAGFNIYMRVTYASFYGQAQAEFDNPGLSSGFIPQDLDYIEGADTWVFSGYIDEDAASPLMVVNASNQTKRVYLEEPDGATYLGHGSGVSSAGDYLYLTADDSYLVFSSSEVVNAQDNATVRALFKQPLDFDPAFLNIAGGKLYTGVFYREGNYNSPDEMHITTPDGTQNKAVMYAFAADASAPFGFAETPERVYSIPGQVQGVCLTTSGNMVFSTSWGFNPSRYQCFSIAGLTQDGTYNAQGEEVPLYCLDTRNYLGEVAGPPMGEGIVLHNGRIYIANESASNKYIFGKLMGGQTVYALPGDPQLQ